MWERKCQNGKFALTEKMRIKQLQNQDLQAKKREKDMHEYKGYKWNTQKELAKQLGKANSSISAWKYKHPDKNIYDYIDAALDAKKYGGVYKDLQWESYTDLEKKLGKCRGYIHTWLNRNEGKSVYDCIDDAREEKEIPPSEDWIRHYKAVKKYYEENNTIIMPIRYEKEGLKIGRWLSHQREYLRNGSLPKNKIALMESITKDWIIANEKHINKEESRIGEEFVSTLGQKYIITEYKNSKNVTVQFEDGTILKNRSYKNVKAGTVKNPNFMKSKIGESYTMKNGQKATIIRYDGNGKVTVRFEDGTVKEDVGYFLVKTGDVYNPNYSKIMQAKEQCVGKRFKMNNGLYVTITDYKGANNVTIKFDDGTEKLNCRYDCIKKGTISHPNPDAIFKRKGEVYTASNGLKFTITDYRGCKNSDILFEDGEIVKDVRYEALKIGNVKHPTLSRKGKSHYQGFDVDCLAFEEDGKVYYNCHCCTCGVDDIMTPQEMIKHCKSHKEM